VTAPGPRLTIREVGQAILDAVVGHFAVAGIALPERQYLAPGDPTQIAWDCEQLVVALQGIGWGQHPTAGPLATKMGSQINAVGLRHAIYVVSLVRCTPSDGDRETGLVSAQLIHAAGQQFMDDMGVLSQALVEACAEVRAGLDRGSLVEAGAINPEGPSGQYHGMSAPVAITVGTTA